MDIQTLRRQLGKRTNPHYSIVIGHYDPLSKKTEMFKALMDSIEEHSKNYDYEIVIIKDGPSYCESYNAGMKAAKGDWIVVLNDDTLVGDSEWLNKLESDGIASWRVGSFHMHPEPLPDAACFMFSRETFKKLGLIDEVYKDGINYEDTDYFLTAHKLGIPFYQRDINFTHYGYKTTGIYYTENSAADGKTLNRGIFNSRWRL